MKTTALVLLAVLASLPARAMEISLEENRGQRGSIGFVDLQAVFKRYPEAQRAKQSYAEIVRQAEEQVNIRKAELIRMRSDLAALKADREAAAIAPLVVAPAVQAPAPAPQAPAPQAPAAPAPEPAPEPAPAKPADPAERLSGLPGMAPAASTEPLRIALPGQPEETLNAAPPSTAAPAAPAAPAAAPDPAAAAQAQAVAQAQAEEQLRRRDAKVKELDQAVAAKAKEIADKESALAAYQADVQKNLVSIEAKRSDILLAKIYQAVKETAVENGVSVVIDKTAILFGQGSVDLTDKVLKKLEGTLP